MFVLFLQISIIQSINLHQPSVNSIYQTQMSLLLCYVRSISIKLRLFHNQFKVCSFPVKMK